MGKSLIIRQSLFNCNLMVLERYELRDELELESIIRGEASQLEKDLVILTEQRKTNDKRRIDLLGVDSNGILTLIELKVKQDEKQLQQALNYYDWVLNSIDFIRDSYKEKLKEKNIEVQDEMPRIILVAPEFDQRMLTEVKYINESIEVQLFKYICFNIASKKEVIFFPEEILEIKSIEEKPKTMEDFIQYIGDPQASESWKKIKEALEKLSSSTDTYRSGYKFWFKGRKFAQLHRRHGFFYLEYKVEGSWESSDKIKNFDDVKAIQDKIKKSIELVGGNFKPELFN